MSTLPDKIHRETDNYGDDLVGADMAGIARVIVCAFDERQPKSHVHPVEKMLGNR